MTDARLDELARLVGVYRSTVDAMPHPADDLEGWRRGWAKVNDVAGRIDARLDAEPPPDP
jgi:hypothetical protein